MDSNDFKILIVSATDKEINLLTQHVINLQKTEHWLQSCAFRNLRIDLLNCGVGLPSTIYRLTQLLTREKYSLIIHLGIAGSYKEEYKIGSVVHVVSEEFGDLGVNDMEKFSTLFEMGYIDQGSTPFSGGKLLNNVNMGKYQTLETLPKVHGITVNTVSGNATDIDKRVKKFTPDIETMEGAGIFYICLLHEIPFIEIRSVSNKVEPRNIKNWNVPLALINLSDVLIRLLEEINETGYNH
jgi:futalosine hydrolase